MSVTGPGWFNRKRVKDRTSPSAEKNKRPRRSGIMALEPRMMYDAAAAATVGAAPHHHHGDGDHTAMAAAEQGTHNHPGNTGRWDASTSSVWAGHTPQTSNVAMPPPSDAGDVKTTSPHDVGGRDDRHAGGGREIVFIDSRVPDYQALVNGVKPGVTAVVLDANSDGLSQIADYLSAHPDSRLATIDIVAHATPGEMRLGSTTLTDASLAAESDALARIGQALGPYGSLHLYGCDVAAGPGGLTFIADLSKAAGGVDVVGATHDLGKTADGSENWTLDAATGKLKATMPFTVDTMANFAGLLGGPVLSSGGNVGAFTPGGAFPPNDDPFTVDDSLSLSDAGSPTIGGAIVTILNPQTGDRLAVAGLTGGPIPGTNISIIIASNLPSEVLLDGDDTVAHYQAVLDAVTFSTTSISTPRNIQFAVTDGQELTSELTDTISPFAKPGVQVSGGFLVPVYVGGGTPAVLLAPGQLSVTDTSPVSGATVSILPGDFLAGDTLNFSNTSKITGSYDAAHGVLTLTGIASAADYQATLETVSFSSTADPTARGTDNSRDIDWTVHAGTLSDFALGALSTQHAPPTVTAGGGAAYTAGGSAVILDSLLTVNDPDSSGMLVGARVQVVGAFAGDTLQFTPIGNITGSYDPGSGILTLSGNDTVDHYQTALRSVSYSFAGNSDPTNGGHNKVREIYWVVDDGNPTSGTNETFPQVQPVQNDQPTIGLNQEVVTTGIFPNRPGDPPVTTADAGGIPLGSIRTFATSGGLGNFSNAVAADGQILPLSPNAALFSLFEFAYGGNGTTTFALPDLQARLAVGGGTTDGTLGLSDGSDQTTVTPAELPRQWGGTGQPIDNEQPSLHLNYLINTGGTGQSGTLDVAGEVVPFLGNFAPAGYLFAQGQTLIIADYQALFDVIGTTYGGDGVFTFRLPDLTDRTIVGAGTDVQTGNVVALGTSFGPAILNDSSLLGQPVSNYQPSLALNYIIDTEGGIFPGSGSTLQPATPDVGEVIAFAGPTSQIPRGWALAEGQTLQIASNEALFGAIGTQYGGNGQTTFNLPDLVGRSVAGIGTNRSDGTVATLGGTYGSPTFTLQTDQLPLPTVATSVLTIAHVAPTVTAGATVIFPIGSSAPLALDTTLTLTDIDSGDVLTGASVQISGGALSGDVLADNGVGNGGTVLGNITASYDAGSHTLTLSGNDSFAHYQTALEEVTYKSTAGDPSSGGSDPSRTISWTVTDNQSTSTAASSTVQVKHVDAAPTLTVAASAAYTENAAATTLDPALAISDPDGGPGYSATVQITGGFVAGDTLVGGGTYDASTQTFTTAGFLASNATLAALQADLRTLGFSSTSDNPGNGARTLTWTISDGTASSTKTSTVNVTPVNDAPVLSSTGNLPGYTEQAAAVALSSSIAVTDPDSTTLAGATVTISGGLQPGDVLHFADQNGISGGYSAGVLTLTGTATLSQYQAALRSVSFDNLTNDDPTLGGTIPGRRIQWQVDDGSGAGNHNLSNTARVDLTITAVNDSPVNTVPGPQFVAVNGSVAVTGISVQDSDADSADIQVTLSAGHGTLTVRTNVSGGLTTGEVAGNGTSTVKLLGSQAAIDATLAANLGLLYAANANYSGPDTLTFHTSDLGHTGTGGTQTADSAVAITVSNIAVVQTTVLTTDVDGDGIADPGDTVTTTVNITDIAGTAANNLSFTENPLDGMTLVPGTVNVSPIALNDSYALSGNTPITINAANGVLANDIEFLGASFGTGAGQTHVENVSVGPAHGNLVLNADGSFTYTPTTGFSGTDSFTYKEIDAGGLESTAQVTLTVGPRVWYVDSSASATNTDGSFSHPFTSLAAFATGRPDSAGDTIFVYNRGAAYAGTGVTLLDSESLIGDGAPGFQVNGHTLGGNTNVAISDSGGTLVTLGSGNTVRGFDLGDASTDIAGSNFGTLTLDHVSINSNGQALNLTSGTFAATDKFTSITATNISMTSVGGTVDLGNGTLSGAGTAFSLFSGSVSASYHGDLQAGVHIQGETGGAVLFDSGSITASNGIFIIGDTGGSVTFFEQAITLNTGANVGINLIDNTGAIIDFIDAFGGTGLQITTTSGTAFKAIGGGQVRVVPTQNPGLPTSRFGNAIVTTSGTALDIEDTTIGPGGVTFNRISAGTTTTGPTNAIILSNTGTTAGLTVRGDENENEFSGGIIQHTGGDAILLKNTQDVTINAMTIENTGGSGVNGTGVTNFTADKNTFLNNGNGGTESAIAFDGNIGFGTLGAGDNIDGTLTLTRNTFTSPFYAALDVQGNDGTISSANVSNNTITNPGVNGISFVGTGTATTVFRLDSASIASNQFNNLATNALNSAAIQVVVGNSTINGPAAHAGLVTTDFLGRPVSDLNHVISITGNSGVLNQNGGEFINIGSTGGNSFARAEANFAIKNNGTANPLQGGAGPIIQIVNDGFADMAGVVDNNAVEFGASIGIAATNGPGTQGGTVYTPKLSLAVTNNTVFAPTGILLTNASGTSGIGATGGDGTAWFKVAGNTVGGGSTSGVRVNAGNASSADDAVFLDIFGNTSSVGGTAGIGLFKQGSTATVNDFALYDAAGTPDLAVVPTNTQVVTFVNALNPGMAGGTTILGGSNFERDTVQGLPLVVAPGGVESAPTDGTAAAPQDPSAPTTDAGAPDQAPPVTNVDDGALTQGNLDTIVAAAIQRWASTGLSAAQIAYLDSVTFTIADLSGNTLGAAMPGAVTIDVNAAGNGWYIDPTPMNDGEFSTNAGGALFTTPDQAAAGHVDLLTTVMHELGHELGLSDTYAASAAASLMYGTIVDGERRLPVAGETDGAVLGSIAGQEFSVGPMVSVGTLPAGKSVTVTFQATIDPQSDQLVHNPTNQGTVTSSFGTVTTNTVVTQVDTLTLGNQVFFDANANGTFDAPDTGIDNVALTLFADTDNSGGLSAGDTQIATTVTANGGLYSFGGLAPGDYIVRVDAGNFAIGGALAGLAPTSGGTDPDNNIDNDSNGITLQGGVATLPITLAYNTEPTNGSGHDTNNTLDIGFADAPLTAQGGLAVNGVEGAAFSATVATFTDADPNGTLAEFTATIAWGDGTSSAGTVSVDNGVYSVAGTHTYAEQGSYTATATINDVGGATATASSTATVIDAPLTAQNGVAVSGVEGTALTATVATFTDANPNAPLSDFTATIAWGDGTSSAGTVSVDNGVYSVAGTHTYAEEGSYLATADIRDVGGSTATASSTATVADAPLNARGGQGVSGVEGAGLNATVAIFTDANPNAQVNDFTATIDWGDGTSSSGVVFLNGSSFAVIGSHAYAEEGSYRATADIVDVGGSTATASIVAVVTDAPLTAQGGLAVNGVEGAALSATVATFTDANPNGTLADFTATIAWGDGTTSAGTVSVDNGVYSVAGTHTYAEDGSYTATATINDVGGATAVASSTATVADAPLSAQGGLAVNGVEGAAFSATVATFTDADPNSLVSDFTAAIDWGDGTTSAGTVSVDNGIYSVAGTHTYAEEGSYTATADISDVGGSTATASSTATVADAPLDARGGLAVSGVEGAGLNATVAIFTDANPHASVDDFTATIAWGDGTSSSGVVFPNGGSFVVFGSHTYAEAGSYRATANVVDVGGSTATASIVAVVTDAPLTVQGGAAVSGVEGAALSATVATFTDANPDAPVSDFTATIAWGDGTTSAGTVSVDNGVYSVAGTHTYAEEGSYVATADIKDVGGSTATASSTAIVADAPLTALGSLAVSGVEGAAFTATVATFTDANPNAPLGDFTATIAWGDGTSSAGTVSVDNGVYSVAGTHTYVEEGAYVATADIKDVGGSTATASSTAIVADAPLTAQGSTVNGIEGASFTATVATFTDADPNSQLSDFTATIDWGDGTASSAATVSVSNGVYSVTGSHTYLEEGSYTATATIADGGGATAVVSSTATVADAPLTVQQSVIASGDEGVAPTDVAVTFTDADPNSQLGDFTATIAWGDGTTSAGTVSVNNGVYAVTASHTYLEEGSYTATTTIADVGGATATVNGTAVVRDAQLVAQGSPILNGVEGSALTTTVATFSDANPNGTVADFTATIDWGDGTTSGGVIAENGGGFAVTGSHAYAVSGVYTAVVTIADEGGSTAKVTDTADILPAAPRITTLVGTPLNGQTVELRGSGDVGDTVNLYADGNTTTVVGTGTVGAGGTFDITTTATFADGVHTFIATQSDSTHLLSAASSPAFTANVEPNAPDITAVVGQPVNGGRVELQGSGEVGETVNLYADGNTTTVVGTGTVDTGGRFDITTTVAFDAGAHTFTATETNAAHLTGPASTAFTVNVANPQHLFTDNGTNATALPNATPVSLLTGNGQGGSSVSPGGSLGAGFFGNGGDGAGGNGIGAGLFGNGGSGTGFTVVHTDAVLTTAADASVQINLALAALEAPLGGDVAGVTARQANGDPLPDWLKFDPATGRFAGLPPDNAVASIAPDQSDNDIVTGALPPNPDLGIAGPNKATAPNSITVEVLVRDSKGNIAATFFTIDLRSRTAGKQGWNIDRNAPPFGGARHASLPATTPELAAIEAAVRGVTLEPFAWRDMPVRRGDAITVAPAGRAGLTEQLASIGWRSMAAQRNALLASLQGR
jgi:microcystin-dependent protein